MRRPLDPARIHQLLEQLGRRATGPGRIYLTGGASALLEGWRDSTVDVDLKLDPEPPGIFEAIARLKDELAVNVELASPDQFVPPVPGWRERSPLVARHGAVDFHHFDFQSQALAKLARSHDRDLADVQAMVERGLVTRRQLADGFGAIRDQIVRYPALDPAVFAERVARFVAGAEGAGTPR